MKSNLRYVAIALIFIAPLLFTFITVNAQGIVPCGNGTITDSTFDECEVSDLVALAKNLIDWFVIITVVVAALMFVNAGVLYIMSPSNPSNISKAHHIFITTLIGMVVVLCSWMIVNLVMSIYVDPGGWGVWYSILLG